MIFIRYLVCEGFSNTAYELAEKHKFIRRGICCIGDGYEENNFYFIFIVYIEYSTVFYGACRRTGGYAGESNSGSGIRYSDRTVYWGNTL